MKSEQMQSIAQALMAVTTFSDFEKKHELVSIRTGAYDHDAMKELCLVQAIHDSLTTGRGVRWLSDGDGRTSLRKRVEENQPLVKKFIDLGIEITLSPLIHEWNETEDKRSGMEMWSIYLTAKKKS